jgi:ABC-type bacteriocin/lantibiotic exporter with double-glycine peptidase domain
MIRVEQKSFDNGDCGVACVAMVAGLPYETVEQAFQSHGLVRGGNYYTFHRDLIKILDSLGFVVKRRRFTTWEEVVCPAIVKINLRTGNLWHWVVLAEQRKLFDPKPGSPEIVSDYRGRKGAGQYLHVCSKTT